MLKLEAQKLRLFITYGRMGEYRRFVEVLRRLNSTEVAIPGRTPYEEVLKLHRIAWTLLFPSIWEEPMSYAVLESALLGIIPIASRVGRVPEILENTPAKKYMFEPRNSEDLANRVLALLAEKPQSIIDMGLKIRDSVVKKLERSSKQITKHILDILNH